MLTNLCIPAILNIMFSLTYIIIDTLRNNYSNAIIKFFVMIIYTLFFDVLCKKGFSTIVWFIVFIPIIMDTIISIFILFIFKPIQNKNIYI